MTFKDGLRAILCSLMVVCFFSVVSCLPADCQSASAGTLLHNQDVLDLLKTGLSAETVVAKIKSSATAFDTSVDALKELKAEDVPEIVIRAMVEASAPTSAVAPAADNLSNDEFGHVRVYRPRRYMGSMLSPSIWVDKIQVARVGSGRRCSIRLRPGTYEIRSDDKASLITLNVQRGKEYYIRVDEEPGAWKGHGKLTLLPPEQGAGEYRLGRPVENDRRLAKEMLEADSEAIAPDQQNQK